jgi:hypothetical protein
MQKKYIKHNQYIGYFIALNLTPAILSLLLLIAMVKGNNPQVSSPLYLLSGICNVAGFVFLSKK